MWFSGVGKDKNELGKFVLRYRCADQDHADVEKQNFGIC
jgi:hypothetical protein